jgi:hypothetical protein
MDTRPDALYRAMSADLSEFVPFGPVGLGQIPPDASYKQFASSYLLSSVLKKFRTSNTRQADLAAKEKFLTSNKKCRDWKLPQLDERRFILLSLLKKEIDDFLHPEGETLVQSMFDLLEHARTGPGSAVGAKGFSFYAKFFSSRLTTTSAGLYFLYRDYIEWFPDFCEADAICRRDLGSARVIQSSRVSFAPKTTDCSRMICVEPSLNMYFQLGLGTLLEDRLKRWFHINLSTQPSINQRLAQLGSKSGQFSTIDLSSASDSISVNLCRLLFPEWFLNLLMELRSPKTVIMGETVTLEMISTMGNGFTFPLQTIIFSCLIRAAYRFEEIQIHDSLNWACFGDDLIVEAKAFRSVIDLLTMLGFEANSSKTFNEGPFRESCGTDWFVGQPVRPVFVKKLDSLQDIMVAINLLNEWSARTGIPLRGTIAYLLSLVRVDYRLLFVPFEENNDSGIRAPACLVPRNSYIFDRNGSIIYRPFRPKDKAISVFDGTLRVPRGLKRLIFNPQGLELSFVFGELRNGRIPVRQTNRVLYHRKATCTPNWDRTHNFPEYHGNSGLWRRWETAVYINMYNP